MRVIGGSARGMTLEGPTGTATRPTSDKVRGAIFNVLAPIIVDARVCDLYAGTGALGIEALSRGAATCLFIERSPSMCRVIARNLAWTKLTGAARILQAEVISALHRLVEGPGGATDEDSTCGPPYDVIFCDPPYGNPEEIAPMLAMLGTGVLLHEGGTLVVEHAQRTDVPARIGQLVLQRTRRYGDTAVSMWQADGESA